MGSKDPEKKNNQSIPGFIIVAFIAVIIAFGYALYTENRDPDI